MANDLDAEAKRKELFEKETVRRFAEAQAAEQAAADERRARNRAHQGKINCEAAASILAVIAGHVIKDDDQISRAIVVAIAKGEIPHVRIEY